MLYFIQGAKQRAFKHSAINCIKHSNLSHQAWGRNKRESAVPTAHYKVNRGQGSLDWAWIIYGHNFTLKVAKCHSFELMYFYIIRIDVKIIKRAFCSY